MGSSISLTLWAFLGMESGGAELRRRSRTRSATCRSPACSARSAPRSIYILSTTVIQGIVPNAELAESTGPFGLAYAKMFNPTVGLDHHGARGDGVPRLAARLAVHDRADRQGRRPRTGCSRRSSRR